MDRLAVGDNGGAPGRLVQTTTVATYPIAAGEFYACNPVEINGTEKEGNGASL